MQVEDAFAEAIDDRVTENRGTDLEADMTNKINAGVIGLGIIG